MNRKSPRNPNWNYSSAASYFITICCKEHETFFGEIINGKMYPNELGKIADKEWLNSITIRPDMNLSLGEYVVMPNHFHGILTIGDNKFNWNWQDRFGAQSKNVGSVIRGYKAAVKRFANKQNIPFCWQGRYHDHVIRTDEEYNRIKKYIKYNPMNWGKPKHNDKFKCNCKLKK